MVRKIEDFLPLTNQDNRFQYLVKVIDAIIFHGIINSHCNIAISKQEGINE